MSRVSVIVPVYNVAEYVDSCLKSLLEQTYKDIESVVVNDGSTDNASEACCEMSRRDPRIRVINQPNCGVSAARNKGVSDARGEHVCFVDGDDIAHPKMVERLVRSLESAYADGACSGVEPFISHYVPVDLPLESASCTFSAQAACSELLYQCIPNGPIAKLFARVVLADVPFLESLRVGEDLLMNFDVFSRSAQVVVLEEPLYGYRQREGSLMSTVQTSDRRLVVEQLEHRVSPVLSAAIANRIFAKALYAAFEGRIAARSIRFLLHKYRRTVVKDSKSLIQLRVYALANYIAVSVPAVIHRWKARIR
ncbi:glycosyltransferase family 2 protein [Corynebacterium phoceense]|uniref:glycosyltransferase family 2 protein n=1 Tax=Corynebacterium phoceense TaxID=1686286 RepID=UPI003B969392